MKIPRGYYIMIKKATFILLLLFITASYGYAYHPIEADQDDNKKNMETNYGSSIARLVPLTAMDLGVGFGLSYEKLIGKKQLIGIVLPLYMLLENKNGYDDNPAYSGYNEARFNMYAYFTPGVKIYPFGQRKVTYAIGPNLLLAYGGGNDWQYRTDDSGRYLNDVKTTRFRLGVLVNNYVNFQITKSFNLGIEGGLGIRYYDHKVISGSAFYPGNGTYTNGIDITGQFSMTLGLRF